MADRNEADALFATKRKKQQEEQAEQERKRINGADAETGKGCNNGTEKTGKAGTEEREIPQYFYAYEMLP